MRPSSKVGPAMAGPTGLVPPGLSSNKVLKEKTMCISNISDHDLHLPNVLRLPAQ